MNISCVWVKLNICDNYNIQYPTRFKLFKVCPQRQHRSNSNGEPSTGKHSHCQPPVQFFWPSSAQACTQTIEDTSKCVAFKVLDASAAKSASRMRRRKIEQLPCIIADDGHRWISMDASIYAEILSSFLSCLLQTRAPRFVNFGFPDA